MCTLTSGPRYPHLTSGPVASVHAIPRSFIIKRSVTQLNARVVKSRASYLLASRLFTTWSEWDAMFCVLLNGAISSLTGAPTGVTAPSCDATHSPPTGSSSHLTFVGRMKALPLHLPFVRRMMRLPTLYPSRCMNDATRFQYGTVLVGACSSPVRVPNRCVLTFIHMRTYSPPTAIASRR